MIEIPGSQQPTTAQNRILAVYDALGSVEHPATVSELLNVLDEAGDPQCDRTVRRILWLLWELGVVVISGDENRRLYQLPTNTQSEG